MSCQLIYYDFVNVYIDNNDIFRLIDGDDQYDHSTIRLSYEFGQQLVRFFVGGLSTVLENIPKQPAIPWQEIPQKYYGEHFREASRFLTNPLEAELTEAALAIEELRLYADSDPKVADLITVMEQAMETVKNKQGNIREMLDVSEIRKQAEDTKKTIAKSTAVEIAAERVSCLINDAKALEGAVQEVRQVSESDTTDQQLEILKTQ